MTKRVFVLNDGGQDYSAANDFGELIFCTEGTLNKTDIAQLYRLLSPILDESNADDYVLLNGFASLCSVASSIMAALHGEVHFLVYSNGKYQVKDLLL